MIFLLSLKDAEAILFSARDVDRVMELYNLLPEKEKKALDLRFGLTEGRIHTFREIGEILGMGKEGARQLVRRAALSLLSLLERNGGFSF